MTAAISKSAITVLPQEPWMKGDSYFGFTCKECGEEATNKYIAPIRENLLERRLCYMCNYWHEFAEKLENEHHTMTLIGGHVYTPGNRTSGEMRGMAGRRFDIEYIGRSAYVGQRVTTFDLWSGSTLPDHLKAKFPDTAVFLNGAERCQIGETGCWEPSSNKTEPYQLPCKLARPAPSKAEGRS